MKQEAIKEKWVQGKRYKVQEEILPCAFSLFIISYNRKLFLLKHIMLIKKQDHKIRFLIFLIIYRR